MIPRKLALAALLVWCATAFAQTERTPVVNPEPTNPHPLPAYMTPEEALLPLPPVVGSRAAPTGAIYTPAEYDKNDGLIIAWDSYTDVLTEITVKATQNDPNVTIWVVVDNTSVQNSAYNTLSAAGAVMSRVQFIVYYTDTVWMRDYGPRFIINNGARAIIDHTYNRPRPNDDAFSDFLAPLWSTPQYDIPLTHGGGNFHLFDNHDAFMTTLVQTENPGLTAQQIKDLFLQYENVNLTIYTGFPTSFDSTQHIDMWMLPVADNKVIIGQYPTSAGAPYTITEGAVADLTARGYTVYRTPGWNSGGTGGGTHYTYTNAVVLNNMVFMSKFGGSYATQDAAALAVFQTAFAGKTIFQVNNASIITAAGAMHCIVMHVPKVPVVDPPPTATLLTPNGGESWAIGSTQSITWTATDNLAVTSVELYYSTDGGATYPNTIATRLANSGSYTWTVPPMATAQARVKVVARDANSGTGSDTSDANFTIYDPLSPIYTFGLDANPGWTCEGLWQFGPPTGAGTHGGDPTAAHTGTNVYGYNLAGDYENSLATRRYLTTAALDFRYATNVELRFWRWLAIQNTDHAGIEVSNNGVDWTNVWEFSGTSLTPTSWTQVRYDISAVASGHATVYVRWGMGTTDSLISYPGWNIDDVEFWGISTPPPPVCRGDANCDHAVSWRDIDYFVAGLNDNQSGWTALFPSGPTCTYANLDVNNDAHVNWRDIDPFVAQLNKTCP